VNWEKLKVQLAQEANEYLADLREIREDLKSAEGWIAFALLAASAVIGTVWFMLSLGFNPANDHVMSFMARFGVRTCRPLDNFNGVVLFVDFFILIFLTVVSLGNVLNMMRRVRQGLPREPRDLLISAGLLLFVGVGGILFMLWAC
jgi:hypothetical protein